MADVNKKFGEMELGQVFPAGIPHRITIQKVVPRLRIIGMFFDLNKSFLLPSAMAGIKGIKKQYDKHPGSNLLIVGHTDTSGDDNPNLTLSLERADAMAAFLTDDVEEWNKFFTQDVTEIKRWGTREIQLMLSALPDDAPKDGKFFQGEATGINGDETHKAVRRFQESENIQPANGTADPATRKAIIKKYMAIDGTTLPKSGAAAISLTAHGCGENFPADDTGNGVEDQDNRRVEIFFFDGDINPAPQPDRLSRKGATDYPQWLLQVTETIDFRAGGGGGGPQRNLNLKMLLSGTDPLPNRRFRLEVGDAKIDDVTAADGTLTAQVPADAEGGTLTFLGTDANGNDTELWKVELEFDDIPKAGTIRGAQIRLANLGLFPGREDGKLDETTRRSISRFQSLFGLSPESGELDSATVKKLEEIYGS